MAFYEQVATTIRENCPRERVFEFPDTSNVPIETLDDIEIYEDKIPPEEMYEDDGLYDENSGDDEELYVSESEVEDTEEK